jgi:hypothetical protein
VEAKVREKEMATGTEKARAKKPALKIVLQA